jgi:hypothetical protein
MELITTSEVATLLGVTADANLTRIVAAVQEDFRRATGRTFERVERTEYVQGFGPRIDYVFLREAPIAEVTEVRLDSSGVLGAETAVDDLTAFVFDSTADDFRLTYIAGYFAEGRRVARVTYTAGYYSHDDPDAENVPKLPQDLRDGLIEEVVARWRRGTNEQMQAENVSSIGGFTRGKLGTTAQFDRMVRRYKRPI